MRIVSMVNICTRSYDSYLLISIFNNRVSYSASKRFCTLPVMTDEREVFNLPQFSLLEAMDIYLLLLTTFSCLSVVTRFRNMRGNSGQPQKDISKEMNFLWFPMDWESKIPHGEHNLFAQFIQVKENVNGRPHGYPTLAFMAYFDPIGSIPIKLRNYPSIIFLCGVDNTVDMQ